jgi:thiol-disulfide isomerase/thioredoxin
MGTFNLGPFAFPISLLLLFVAMLLSLAVAKWAGRARAVDVEPQIWKVLMVGVLGARVAFIAAYFDMYKSAPLSILDIRDGGFIAPAGILAAFAMTTWFAMRKREGCKPLILSVLAGVSVWVLGVVATLLFYPGPAEMPQIALTRLDDSTVQLKSLLGKPVVVNLWATWCPPCRREMPVLRDGQARYRNVVFVFANEGESADAVRAYLNTEHLVLDNMLLDSDRNLGNQTRSRVLPTTLFFNEKGVLVDRRIGELSAATLAQRMESLRTPP